MLMRTSLALLAVGPIVAQEPSRPKPNAAVLYELALEEIRTAFGITADGALELPPKAENESVEWRFAEPEWDPLIERSAVALTVFAQAARIPRCEFGAATDPIFHGYDERALQLVQLAQLTAARGWRRLASSPADAAGDAFTLLRHTRHAMRQPTTTGATFGYVVEIMALALLRGSLAKPLTDEARARCLRELGEHAGERPSTSDFAAASETEIARMLGATIGRAAGQPPVADPVEAAARENAEAITRRVLDLARELLAPLRQDELPAVEEIEKRTKANFDRLREGTRRKEIARRIADMRRAEIVDVLSRQLALVMLPDLTGLIRKETLVRDLIRECRALADPETAGK